MAQDIIDAGGSLATLLRAGEWRSSAFLKYLRDCQPEEAAISQVVINLSDSEDELCKKKHICLQLIVAPVKRLGFP